MVNTIWLFFYNRIIIIELYNKFKLSNYITNLNLDLDLLLNIEMIIILKGDDVVWLDLLQFVLDFIKSYDIFLRYNK